MKKPSPLWIVVGLNLLVLLALVFAVPHLMISPGALVKGHESLTTDCFACHNAWRGASSALCTECHVPADIGLRTTRGERIPAPANKGVFHQDLEEQDCMACHSDHQGPRLTQRSRKPFSHGLLRTAVQERCSSCHTAPKDSVHRQTEVECKSCHESTRWKPAHFDHRLLSAAQLKRCDNCHSAPSDRLHRQLRGGCESCHKTEAWTPATFDHAKYFVLDRDHETTCETCHKNHVYSRYTCYGCHEHSQANVRDEHLKEGIRDFENCVECHRDPGVEPDKRGTGGKRKHDD